MKYFKRKWEEIRSDEFGAWGTSWWYLETSDSGLPTRQIEVYENGKVLKYDQVRHADKFGSLADQPLNLTEFSKFEIHSEEFEMAWNAR